MLKPKGAIWLAVSFLAMLSSCNKKEESVTPSISNEALTTVTLKLTNTANSSDTLSATWEQLLNADGTPKPVDVSRANMTLKANTTYTGQLTILDKSQNPVANISEEIEERGNIHLFFYQPLPSATASVIPGTTYPAPIPATLTGNPLNLTVTITDRDSNNPPLPIGLATQFTTGAASTGWLRLVLRHQPNGKNGTFAPGSTDLDVGYQVTIQ